MTLASSIMMGGVLTSSGQSLMPSYGYMLKDEFYKEIREIVRINNMCDKCKHSDKKDASDYVINNDHNIEFIKTYDKTYIKPKVMIQYYTLWNDLQNYAYVACKDDRSNTWVIEKFSDKKEAEAFLEDLIEAISE